MQVSALQMKLQKGVLLSSIQQSRVIIMAERSCLYV
uniref:Uncharacterized protein n=1 Tax=Anguilla anguilla TaxID=7936 RepID=A0A0E9SFS5_ANGAN